MSQSAIQTRNQPSNVVSDKHKQERKMNDLFKIQRPDVTGLLTPTRNEKKKKVNYGQSIKDVLIHLVVCLTRGPKPLPKRALHIVRSRASSFK